MPTISAQWDIFSLIQHFASIDVAYKSTVHGVLEVHSNCPWCPGSKDSFICEPETGRYSHAIRSSGCGRTGDCIDFLKDYKGMTHSEACDFLGIEHNADFVPSAPSKSQQNGKECPPPARWQDTGKLLVERAQSALWSPLGKDMLDYLHGRGLGDEIIKKKKLGYIPPQKNGSYYEAELEDWGLDLATCAKDKVRIPNGILIPWFEGSTLWRLALKRPGEKQSYGQVIGSGEGLYNVDTIQYNFPVMMVEGEICCMSVEQEVGDLIACVATGSSTRARLNRWIQELRLASCILQSFDEDEGGDEGAQYWLEALKGQCQRWSPYVAKDPNDILLKKFLPDRWECSLREWVEAGLQTVEVAKPAIIQEIEVGLELARPFDLASSPPIPLAREKTLNELVQEKRKEKGLPPMPISPWTERENRAFEKSFSQAKIVGPGVDLIELSKKEYIRANLAPGICLNKNCPCGT